MDEVMMLHIVERINADNYSRFEDMLYWREKGIEREPAQAVSSDEALCELADPNLYLYSVLCDGRYVGWISLIYMPKVSRVKRGYVYVDELWVEPSYRGRGFARMLMAEADRLRSELKAAGLRLYVNVENPAAMRLYESCGYAQCGQAYFMEK